MLGYLARFVSKHVYPSSNIPEDRRGEGPFGNLKMAVVTDAFTSLCLAEECRIRCLTPHNYREVLTSWKPDLLFVESVFHGANGEWRYLVGRQSKIFNPTGAQPLKELVPFALEQNIPSVFWNKDDSAFFDHFLETAGMFPYVFTTDETCVPRYQKALSPQTKVGVLAMPFQPKFHSFTGFNFKSNSACFAGSYYKRILNARRQFLDMLFAVCHEAGLPLHVYDRNSRRFSHFLDFSFPKDPYIALHDAVPHTQTARIYKEHAVSLNVNSVTTSRTMCSRRLLEILACGGILVTNTSPLVEEEFAEFCHVVRSREDALGVLSRIAREGPDESDKERARAGAAHVMRHHTWQQRLRQLGETVPF